MSSSPAAAMAHNDEIMNESTRLNAAGPSTRNDELNETMRLNHAGPEAVNEMTRLNAAGPEAAVESQSEHPHPSTDDSHNGENDVQLDDIHDDSTAAR